MTILTLNKQELEAKIGTIDETISHISLLICKLTDQEIKSYLSLVEDDLFEINSYLSGEKKKTTYNTDMLEVIIDLFDNELKPCNRFIKFNNEEVSSLANMARCVVRRAERRAIKLNKIQPVDKEILNYLNRLSTLLFVISRLVLKKENVVENYFS